MSSNKHLSKQEVADVIHYLERVVPRGQEDADYLYALLTRLKEMLASR